MAGKGIFRGKKDPKELTPLAVDQRVNKAFDPGMGGAASKMIASDVTGSFAGGSVFIDEAPGGLSNAIVGDPAAPAASIVEAGDSAGGLHMRLVEQDLNVAASAAAHDLVDVPGIGSVPANEANTYVAGTGPSAVADITISERYLTQDEALFAYHAGLAAAVATDAPSVNATNLRRIEGDLDTSGTAFEDGASVNEQNMRRIEGDLDVTQGTNLDLPSGNGPSITEY